MLIGQYLKIKQILPRDAIGGVCVVTAGVVALTDIGQEVALGGLIAGGIAIIAEA
ncbi:hypothetical protein [Lacrimispora indolis]|uniref:hypothetical protein n=1 Tax=Lacrimispora indolis TaxID=69825 RepID=UPI0004AFC78E|nr:hypothetical protein [Lacrimispora indolis]